MSSRNRKESKEHLREAKSKDLDQISKVDSKQALAM